MKTSENPATPRYRCTPIEDIMRREAERGTPFKGRAEAETWAAANGIRFCAPHPCNPDLRWNCGVGNPHYTAR